MIDFLAQLPPRNPKRKHLSIDCDFLLADGYMASGVLRFEENGLWEAFAEKEHGGFRKCDPIKWRPKKS